MSQLATLSIIDLQKIYAAKLETSPFDYFIASGCISSVWQDKLIQSYPKVKGPGSFPLSTVSCNSEFRQLIDEMNSDDFREAVEQKFSLDLKGRPTMFSVRGQCRLKDGKIHTDSESKIITILLYMNPSWQNQGGRLRLLRSPDIEDVAAEVSPEIGTILMFRRCDHSYHGHLPFEGTRRVIQMNWVTEQKYVDQEQDRHRLSAFFKNFKNFSFFSRPRA